MVFLPGNRMSFDEGTTRYNGRMPRLKHKQSRYKPYDGIRIYMLNDSATGLMFVLILTGLSVWLRLDDAFTDLLSIDVC